MATYEVSTWAELVAKLSATTLETRTIKLTADIDCNDEIPEGVANTINVYSSRNYPLTIDGSYTENGITKNHVIRNLRTHVTSPKNIFKLTYLDATGENKIPVVRFYNIDFINLILDGGMLIGQFEVSWQTYGVLGFYNCSFVGRRNRYLVCGHSMSYEPNYMTFSSCFFNIPYEPSGTSNTYVPLNDVWRKNSTCYATANYCRFKESYNGWTIGSFAPAVDVNPHCSTHNLNLNGCYIDGTIVGASDAIGITEQYTYNSTIQNVVDADLRSYGNSGSTTVKIYAPKGIYKTAEYNDMNVVKKYDDDTVNCAISNQNASAMPETPSRMISPSDLYSDGFDIVVPE